MRTRRQASLRRRLCAWSIAAGAATAVSAGDGGPLPLANASGRRQVSLNGDWRAIVDPYGHGGVDYRAQPRRDGYFMDARPSSPSDLVEYDFDTSPVLKVPGDWNTQRPELLYYEGPLWYRRRFDLAPEPGRRYLLHFEAANYAARVFVNARPAGDHEGGFTPFSFDVTSLVRPGSNTVVVMVDNTRRREAVPTWMTDWWNYGGLTRPVRLLDLPETFIRDYHLQLEPGSRRTLSGWVRLDGPRAAAQDVTLRLPEAGIARRVRTGADGRAEVRFDAEVERWSPERPRLYEVEIASEADRVAEPVGFRSIEVRGTEILLNGEPIFLRGVCAHEEAPLRGGRAWSVEDARTQLGWVKELGGNFVRLAHYPHNETIVREADRLGVLVWGEIPVYWTIDWEDPRPLASARQQLAEMIGRDRNRAAVILWSVANETPIGEARNAFLRTLIDDARRLDPTRLLTAALQARREGYTLVIDDPIAERLDVMGNNEYIGWYEGLPEQCDRTEFRSPWPKPLVMSEFGGDALFGHRGPASQRWTEDYQEDLYQHQLAMLKRIPFLRGTAPWILMDFRSPRRPLPVIQDGWNRKGLLSERGQRKRAFYVLQRFYEEMAGKTPR